MSVATPKRQLHSRKSYCILPAADLPLQHGSPQGSHGDRILSETTGLAKFLLSPNRATKSLSTKKSGLPVYIPIEDGLSAEAEEEVSLLEKFAKKQRQLVELEKQLELVKFEILEMSEQIKASSGNVNLGVNNTGGRTSNNSNSNTSSNTRKSPNTSEPCDAAIARSTFLESPSKLNFLKNKASNIFNIELQPSQAQPIQEYFNKFQNQLNQTKIIPRDALKNIVNDVGRNLDENNTKIKQFINANPTTKKFNELINTLSPTKPNTHVQSATRKDVAESSFMFDNLDLDEIQLDNSIYERESSVIFEGDEELMGNSSNIVDIDDYESDEENL